MTDFYRDSDADYHGGAAIPEPESYLLWLIGLVGVLLLYHGRRRGRSLAILVSCLSRFVSALVTPASGSR